MNAQPFMNALMALASRQGSRAKEPYRNYLYGNQQELKMLVGLTMFFSSVTNKDPNTAANEVYTMKAAKYIIDNNISVPQEMVDNIKSNANILMQVMQKAQQAMQQNQMQHDPFGRQMNNGWDQNPFGGGGAIDTTPWDMHAGPSETELVAASDSDMPAYLKPEEPEQIVNPNDWEAIINETVDRQVPHSLTTKGPGIYSPIMDFKEYIERMDRTNHRLTDGLNVFAQDEEDKNPEDYFDTVQTSIFEDIPFEPEALTDVDTTTIIAVVDEVGPGYDIRQSPGTDRILAGNNLIEEYIVYQFPIGTLPELYDLDLATMVKINGPDGILEYMVAVQHIGMDTKNTSIINRISQALRSMDIILTEVLDSIVNALLPSITHDGEPSSFRDAWEGLSGILDEDGKEVVSDVMANYLHRPNDIPRQSPTKLEALKNELKGDKDDSEPDTEVKDNDDSEPDTEVKDNDDSEPEGLQVPIFDSLELVTFIASLYLDCNTKDLGLGLIPPLQPIVLSNKNHELLVSVLSVLIHRGGCRRGKIVLNDNTIFCYLSPVDGESMIIEALW